MSPWAVFFLRFQRSMLDLSLQWRFARLPNNAKLEMVPVSGRAGAGSTVRSFRSVTRFVPFSALLGMIWSGRRSRSGSGVAYISHTDGPRCGAECSLRSLRSLPLAMPQVERCAGGQAERLGAGGLVVTAV